MADVLDGARGVWTAACDTEPSTTGAAKPWPWEPRAIRSAPQRLASSTMCDAGDPSTAGQHAELRDPLGELQRVVAVGLALDLPPLPRVGVVRGEQVVQRLQRRGGPARWTATLAFWTWAKIRRL
jgi:hypothetical protein